MEEGLLVQSMDSLWFFSSVFSSSKTKPKFQSFEGKIDLEGEPEKPISPIPQIDQNEQPNAHLGAETEKLESIEPELGNAIEEEDDQNLEAKKEKMSSRRKRRRRRRKVLGELELEVDLRLNYERFNGLGIRGIGGNEWGKMPPLSDGVAMKEHIKCWAHAVACTVR